MGSDWGAAGFAPWWTGRRFESGQIRLALLALLEERPRHGYDLMKELDRRFGSNGRVSAGSIYPTLQLLEDEGLVTSRQEDGRKVYELTDAGRAELDREREHVDRLWRKAAEWQQWSSEGTIDTAAVWISFGKLAKAVAGSLRRSGGDSKKAERIREKIDQLRTEIEAS
jgi:DNA-binding PadR family transcriptional regulator